MNAIFDLIKERIKGGAHSEGLMSNELRTRETPTTRLRYEVVAQMSK